VITLGPVDEKEQYSLGKSAEARCGERAICNQLYRCLLFRLGLRLIPIEHAIAKLTDVEGMGE
jgi:hypothetical protein